MKKLICSLFSLTLVLTAFSQEEEKKYEYNPKTLFGKTDHSIRAFIGFNSKGMMLNDQLAVLGGGEFVLVFGHKLNVGFFGYGKTNQIQSNFIDYQGYRHYYSLGLGGFKIEPVAFTNSLVHFTVPIKMGAGAIAQHRYSLLDYSVYDDNFNYWDGGLYDFDTFVFVEPGVSAEINLLKHLRLNAGVGYFITDAVRLAGAGALPLNGLTGNISLRLGWF